MKPLRLGALLGLAMLAACAPLQELGRALRLTAPISLAPDSRLARAARDPAQCQALLREEGVQFTPARDTAEGDFCLVQNSVLLGERPIRTMPARTMMTCPLAASFLLWSRYSVEPAAREILGTELRQVDHFGVYACRRVYGQTEGRPSAHARAEAIDVAGFRFADGRRVTVLSEWRGAGREAEFLRRVREDACRVFGSVLSPDYNAAHANHLHLEVGGRGPCS